MLYATMITLRRCRPSGMVYFIGDLHFGHTSVIRHDSRPWDTLPAMHAGLIERWNSAVTDTDTVYVMGDVVYANNPTKELSLVPYVRQLSGHKILIRGNHDRLLTEEMRQCFDDVQDYLVTTVEVQTVVLFHFPIVHFTRQPYGAVHIYAHMHAQQLEHPIPCSVCASACLPYMNYTPQPLKILLSRVHVPGPIRSNWLAFALYDRAQAAGIKASVQACAEVLKAYPHIRTPDRLHNAAHVLLQILQEKQHDLH